MTEIKTEKVVVEKSPKEVFNFLSDMNNLRKLMPPQVTYWVNTENDCTFTVTGMASLGLKYEKKNPDSEIIFSRHGKVLFDYFLRCNIEPVGDISSLQLNLEADLNPFLKMMAEKPLTNFLKYLAERLPQVI